MKKIIKSSWIRCFVVSLFVIISLFVGYISMGVQTAFAGNCTSAYPITPYLSDNSIVGGGNINCPYGHSHTVLVCLQRNVGGLWSDLQCHGRADLSGGWWTYPKVKRCASVGYYYRSRINGTGLGDTFGPTALLYYRPADPMTGAC